MLTSVLPFWQTPSVNLSKPQFNCTKITWKFYELLHQNTTTVFHCETVILSHAVYEAWDNCSNLYTAKTMKNVCVSLFKCISFLVISSSKCDSLFVLVWKQLFIAGVLENCQWCQSTLPMLIQSTAKTLFRSARAKFA